MSRPVPICPRRHTRGKSRSPARRSPDRRAESWKLDTRSLSAGRIDCNPMRRFSTPSELLRNDHRSILQFSDRRRFPEDPQVLRILQYGLHSPAIGRSLGKHCHHRDLAAVGARVTIAEQYRSRTMPFLKRRDLSGSGQSVFLLAFPARHKSDCHGLSPSKVHTFGFSYVLAELSPA